MAKIHTLPQGFGMWSAKIERTYGDWPFILSIFAHHRSKVTDLREWKNLRDAERDTIRRLEKRAELAEHNRRVLRNWKAQ